MYFDFAAALVYCALHRPVVVCAVIHYDMN